MKLETKWENPSYCCCAFPDLLDAGDDMSQFGNLNTNWVIVIQGTKVPYS